jgi:hypothetical protein
LDERHHPECVLQHDQIGPMPDRAAIAEYVKVELPCAPGAIRHEELRPSHRLAASAEHLLRGPW